MTEALTDRKNRKQCMRRILLIELLLSLLCAGTGCAQKQAADDVVRDIVPENGIGADGMPAGEPGRDDEAVSTWGGADANEKEQETAQVGRLTLTLPAGYQQSTTSGLYLNQNYPDDQSNVYIYTTEKTTDFEQVMTGGQEQFIGYLADAYEQQYEERPEITLTRYEAASIGEMPAYVVEISYDLKGVHYNQLEYIVDADKTYYIAFSQVGECSWMEAFYASAGTMFFSEAE